MLSAKQKKCLELMVQGNLKQKEIAQQIKVSEVTVSNWKKDEEFITELNTLLKNAIKSTAAKAFNTELTLLNAKSEMVRLMAAKDILDRAGFKPEDNMNISGTGTVVIVDDITE